MKNYQSNVEVKCYSNGRYVGSVKKEEQFGNIFASETLYQEELCSDWHYHLNPHFSHILNGGSIELREKEKLFQTAGSFLYYDSNIIHKNINYQKNTRIFNLEIQPSFLKKFDLVTIASGNIFSPYSEHVKKNLIIKILKEYNINDKDSGLSIQQLSLQLFQNNDYKCELHNKHWSIQLKDYLYAHWNKTTTLSELGAVLQIHPVTISKYFFKYFKFTLGEYKRRIKVEKSLALIRSNKFTLTEIAYECDFTDQSHFTKTFKQVTGLLPKKYKSL